MGWGFQVIDLFCIKTIKTCMDSTIIKFNRFFVPKPLCSFVLLGNNQILGELSCV